MKKRMFKKGAKDKQATASKRKAVINKFKQLSKATARFSLPLVVFFLWVYLLVGAVGNMHGFTSDPFKLNRFADWVLVIAWLLSGTLPMMWLLVNRTYHAWLTLVAVFGVTMFASSLWPVSYQPGRVTAATVKTMIQHTTITIDIAVACLVVGLIVTLILTRRSIQKSNWWVFIVILPYTFMSWFIYVTWQGFKTFTTAKNFDPTEVSRTLAAMNGKVNLINSIQFNLIAIAIIALTVFVGGILSDFTREKVQAKDKTLGQNPSAQSKGQD